MSEAKLKAHPKTYGSVAEMVRDLSEDKVQGDIHAMHLERHSVLVGLLLEWMKDHRACSAIAADCHAGESESECGCLYCRTQRSL